MLGVTHPFQCRLELADAKAKSKLREPISFRQKGGRFAQALQIGDKRCLLVIDKLCSAIPIFREGEVKPGKEGYSDGPDARWGRRLQPASEPDFAGACHPVKTARMQAFSGLELTRQVSLTFESLKDVVDLAQADAPDAAEFNLQPPMEIVAVQRLLK